MATSIDPVPNSLSNEDLDVIFKSFQDKNFLSYLEEFTKDISEPQIWNQFDSNPELLHQRDVDIASLQPTPGIALQVDRNDNDSIVYINIAVSDKIEKPSFSCEKHNSDSGFKWFIPHAIVNPRLEFSVGETFAQWLSNNEVLHSSSKIEVESILNKIRSDGIWIYDIIVNPVCLDLSRQNGALKQCLVKTAIENIEDHLKIKLKNVKILGFDLYVGNPLTPLNTSVKTSDNYDRRKRSFDSVFDGKVLSDQTLCEDVNMKSVPYSNAKLIIPKSLSHNIKDVNDIVPKFPPPQSSTPKYKLKHVNHLKLQNYTKVKDDRPLSLRPDRLNLEIILPGVKSVTEIDAKAIGKEFHLKTDKYSLDIILPYEVEEEPYKAKYDISLCVLEIELTVSKRKELDDFDSLSKISIPPIITDSGTESENGYRTNSISDNSSVPPPDKIGEHKNGAEKDKTVSNILCQSFKPEYKLFESEDLVIIKIDSKIIDTKSIKLEVLSQEVFQFCFNLCGTSPSLYKETMSVAPHSYKDNGVSYQVSNSNVKIQIEKIESGTWNKIKIGSEEYLLESQQHEALGTDEECGMAKIFNYSPKESCQRSPGTSDCRTNDTNKSLSCDKDAFECDNIKISAETKEDIAAFFKQPLFPNCCYTQSHDFLFISIKCKNINVKNFMIEALDSKTFKYQYKQTGNGFAPLLYGGFVCTAPHVFKNKGITHHILEDTLLIQVEKKKPSVWRKIKVGLGQKRMKIIKLKGPESKKKETKPTNEAPSTAIQSTEDSIPQTTEILSENEAKTLDGSADSQDATLSETKEDDSTSKMKIPNRERRTSDCFLTGSWPRGILKARSRSLSDSQMDSENPILSSSLEAENEVLMEEDCESEEEGGGSPTKKSVHFNEFVCKQLFRIDASILGQKAKNQKKANQKKRARERRLSEGHSSEGETVTEQSDCATTTEEESNTDGEHGSKKGARVPKKKKDPRKKKNKKPALLQLSSEVTEMIFQLDDD